MTLPATTKAGITATCGCYGGGRRHPPIRVQTVTAELLRRVLGDEVHGLRALVLADYRCPGCKQLVPLTIADLLAVA